MDATNDIKRRVRKRADGEGSIRYSEAKKVWVARLMVGYRPDGKPDIREVSAKTQKACRAKLDVLKSRLAAGTLGDVKAGREMVDAYLDWWLTSIEGTMDADSLRRDRDGVKRMKPQIGRHKIADLRPEHVVTMLTTLRSTTYKRGAKGEARTLSPRTIRYCYVTLRKALDTALRNGAVPRNVARLIEAPPSRRSRSSRTTPRTSAGSPTCSTPARTGWHRCTFWRCTRAAEAVNCCA